MDERFVLHLAVGKRLPKEQGANLRAPGQTLVNSSGLTESRLLDEALLCSKHQVFSVCSTNIRATPPLAVTALLNASRLWSPH